jgi:hypothetical protein
MTLIRSAPKIESLSIYVQDEDVLLSYLATYTNGLLISYNPA